jgi:X-X-X-Leu-X-X-Gly heptad repeat protein
MRLARIIALLLSSIPAWAGFAFVQSNGAFVDATSTTIAVGLTSVTANSLIILWVKWEGAITTITGCSDGTNSLTVGPSNIITNANNDLHGATFYLLISSSGTKTYTCTLGATRPYRQIVVMEFSGDAGETRSTDGSNEAQAGSGDLASGTITTAGTDDVVVGTYGNYSGVTTSDEQIGGVAAAGRQEAGAAPSSMWYRILTATMTTGQATADVGTVWISQILAIKSVASATNGRFLLTGVGGP